MCLICLNMKCLSLPGITNVWYILRDDLPSDVVYRSVAGIPIILEVTPEDITLKGEAVCEVEQSYDNNSYIEKVKLTFQTLDDVPIYEHPAFVIKTVNDDIYGLPDGDTAVCKYEVSFTAKKALALCIE